MRRGAQHSPENSPGPRPAHEPSELPPNPHRFVAEDAETYASSVEGVDLDAIRAGTGERPTSVVAASSEHLTFNAGSVGFPMLSRTTVPDSDVMVAYVSATPPGCKWCEIDLAPGMVIAYSPGAEHTSRSLPGLVFSCVVTENTRLAETADILGTRFETLVRGQVHQLAATPRTRPVRPLFSGFTEQLAAGATPSRQAYDELLRTMVHALSETDRTHRVGSARRIDSRDVVRTCIDQAHALGRIPSIRELCEAAHVSERRLRHAFSAEFDIPPARFFRLWGLDRARRQLTHDAESHRGVTDIAADLGFGHLSRFALDYGAIYGEPPSSTLKRHRSATTGPSSAAA